MNKDQELTPQLHHQLVKDGLAIQVNASKRLADMDLVHTVSAAIVDTKSTSRYAGIKRWSFGLAAAISLSLLTWVLSQNSMSPQIDEIQHSNQLMVTIKQLDLNFKQLPLTVEEKFYQPLLDEQQAIITDLKSLKVQWTSI